MTNVNFKEFIYYTQSCNDKFWDDQYKLVHNMKGWNYYINFVMHYPTIYGDTKRLLEQLDRDDDGNGIDIDIWKKGESILNDEITKNSHLDISKYYTPEDKKIVKERFSKDYDLLCKYFPDFYCKKL